MRLENGRKKQPYIELTLGQVLPQRGLDLKLQAHCKCQSRSPNYVIILDSRKCFAVNCCIHRLVEGMTEQRTKSKAYKGVPEGCEKHCKV